MFIGSPEIDSLIAFLELGGAFDNVIRKPLLIRIRTDCKNILYGRNYRLYPFLKVSM
jgi:hypothetical protein